MIITLFGISSLLLKQKQKQYLQEQHIAIQLQMTAPQSMILQFLDGFQVIYLLVILMVMEILMFFLLQILETEYLKHLAQMKINLIGAQYIYFLMMELEGLVKT